LAGDFIEGHEDREIHGPPIIEEASDDLLDSLLSFFVEGLAVVFGGEVLGGLADDDGGRVVGE
jgi:hypothetical protein